MRYTPAKGRTALWTICLTPGRCRFSQTAIGVIPLRSRIAVSRGEQAIGSDDKHAMLLVRSEYDDHFRQYIIPRKAVCGSPY